MNQQVAAVEPNGQKDDNLFAEDDDASGKSPPSGGRFVYASGSRPLDGYTIKRGIGHGGFGEVYFAMSDAGKEVALKLVRRNLDVELRGIRQCLNLKHPNLLSIHDIREDAQGDNWVVMEYVSEQCLDEVVAAHPDGLPPEQALAWIHGVAAGVACLHDHGIVHRDLKPGNIFLDEGMVKIGDYGLSKFISCSRRSGQTESIGTVHYMAPEVANGRYGKEIDVYALGVLFYEILTGCVPFEGESIGEVLMKHLTAEPDVSMLAQPYRSVVAKALEKDPAKRYATATAMVADLPKPAMSDSHFGPVPTAHIRPETDRREEPETEEVHTAEVVDEEPVYRAVRQTIHDVRDSWHDSKMNAPTKLVILILCGFALLNFWPLLFAIVPMLLVAYCVYYVIRQIVLSISPSPRHGPRSVRPATAHAHRQAAAASVRAHRQARRHPSRLPRWAAHEKATQALVLKPPRERIAELLGSMLASALVCVVMCFMGVVFHSLGTEAGMTVQSYAQCAWLIMVGIAGTWAVLIPSKLWEGTGGDVILRRFVLLIFGLTLGLVAAGAVAGLMVDLPHDIARFNANGPVGELTGNWSASLHAVAVAGELPYYLAGFGLLLMLIRWWRLSDPLRATRLSLWAVFKVAVMAYLVADLCGFPQPWLILVSCAMAVSLQLASTWIPPRLRTVLREMD